MPVSPEHRVGAPDAELVPTSSRLLASGRTEEVIPLVEEVLHLSKRTVETGRVRVSLITETVEETLRETLRSRRTEIGRVPVGREVKEVPATRQEGDVMIVSVVEEELVVVRRLGSPGRDPAAPYRQRGTRGTACQATGATCRG